MIVLGRKRNQTNRIRKIRVWFNPTRKQTSGTKGNTVQDKLNYKKQLSKLGDKRGEPRTKHCSQLEYKKFHISHRNCFGRTS
ncbi:hypothetical protein Ahy_B07g087467 isoform C [Arachis hypogaea]|uniref:Uncharacterized protein n=1 Tax=Arachis hypogaea TaxID=3818 RepID=A0A444YC75_ARAHY|nr:hypothetical protein Ahy_B07g087467 isoform A [Arachis hypogaea]RYQ99528.1 hypothetical protein Ahy_B07g087467 isoform C [Arachis hypogaea]